MVINIKKIIILIIGIFVFLIMQNSFVVNADSQYVRDTGNVLSQKTENKVDEMTHSLISVKGSPKLAVVTVKALPKNVSMREYKEAIFRQLKINNTKWNNGLVLFLFLNNKKCEIELGEGLSNVLSNVSSVMSPKIINQLNNKNFNSGILNIVNNIVVHIKNNQNKIMTPIEINNAVKEDNNQPKFPVISFVILLLLIFVLLVVDRFL